MIPLPLEKDIMVDLHVKIIAGHRSSIQDHVFESVHRLPKYSAFELIKSTQNFKESTSFVQCIITERINRVVLWINQNFTSKYSKVFFLLLYL